MPTLEDQIARLADAAFERTDPVAFDPLVHRTSRRPWTSPVGLAAGLLLTAALAGLLAMVWFRDVDDTPAPAATFPHPPTLNEPTVTYPVDEQWLVPDVLPADVQYEGAQRFEMGGIQWLSYVDPTGEVRVTVTLGEGSGLAEPTREVELGGRVWHSLTDAAGWVAHDATVDGVEVDVMAWGVTESTADEIVASLTWQQARTLPRPPLTLSERSSVLVATATQDALPVELRADTDGVAFTLGVHSGGGGASTLDPGEVLDIGSASGPRPNMVIGGRESESLIYGLARADVATVVVELTDGRTVSAPVQDISGRFVEDFYIVAVPTRTEGGFELMEAIVALDAEGDELFRGPSPF